MERKSNSFKILNRIMLVIMAITTVTQSLCFADTSSAPDLEMMAAFSDFIDTELGDRANVLLEERGLEMDLKNGVSTIAPGGEIILVPLISIDSHQMAIPKASPQKSHFLAYINHETLGPFPVFLEVVSSQSGEMTAMKIVFPSGRGVVLNMNPFYIYQLDAYETGISLQDNDDLENTIIVLDLCDTLRIIAITLLAACFIFTNPILCGIAAAVETVYQIIC